MSWTQLRTPNLGTVGNIGACLAFVEYAFKTPHGVYAYAYNAWEGAKHKHADREFPEGMYVPIYFTYMLNGKQEGHIAIRKPNGQIFSSPWHPGTHNATLDSIEELIRIYSDNGKHPMGFLGWSEDLCGVQLVESFTPAPPAPPPIPYTVTNITPKQVVLNKQPTHQYGLNHQTFEEVAANVTATGNLGDIKTVVAELHHKDGYTYYLENASNPVGWNVLDCNDYTPPAPKAPYVAPLGAAPVKKAETYQLLTALPYYGSVDDVQNNRNPIGMLPEGSYYVWSKAGSNNIYYNLTSDNTKNLNHYVNILNNVAPKPVTRDSVTVEPITAPSMTTAEIRASYRPIPDGPMDVSAKTNILVTDIVGSGQPITITPGKPFHIYGTFRKNSQWYAMPKINATDPEAANYLYGIPINSSTSLEPFLEAAYGYPERISYGVAAIYDKIQKTIEGIWHPQRK